MQNPVLNPAPASDFPADARQQAIQNYVEYCKYRAEDEEDRLISAHISVLEREMDENLTAFFDQQDEIASDECL